MDGAKTPASVAEQYRIVPHPPQQHTPDHWLPDTGRGNTPRGEHRAGIVIVVTIMLLSTPANKFYSIPDTHNMISARL